MGVCHRKFLRMKEKKFDAERIYTDKKGVEHERLKGATKRISRKDRFPHYGCKVSWRITG